MPMVLTSNSNSNTVSVSVSAPQISALSSIQSHRSFPADPMPRTSQRKKQYSYHSIGPIVRSSSHSFSLLVSSVVMRPLARSEISSCCPSGEGSVLSGVPDGSVYIRMERDLSWGEDMYAVGLFDILIAAQSFFSIASRQIPNPTWRLRSFVPVRAHVEQAANRSIDGFTNARR
jgi:hypothetical protein